MKNNNYKKNNNEDPEHSHLNDPFNKFFLDKYILDEKFTKMIRIPKNIDLEKSELIIKNIKFHKIDSEKKITSSRTSHKKQTY